MPAIRCAGVKGEVLSVPTFRAHRTRSRLVPAAAKTYDFSGLFDDANVEADTVTVPDSIVAEAAAPVPAEVAGPSDAVQPTGTPALEMPKFEMPEMPSFELPEMPSFEMPKFSMPSFESPTTEAAPKELTAAAEPAAASAVAPPAAPAAPAAPELPSSVASMLDDLKALQENASDAPSAGGDPLAAVTDTVDAASKSVSDAVGGALSAVTSLSDSMTSGVRGALDTVTSEVSNSQRIVSENFSSLVPKETQLPPELQAQVDAVGATFVELQNQFNEAPLGYSILGALALSVPAYLVYQAKYSGFEGSYSPEELAQALQQEENILVVDIRPRTELEASGVLDLRRGARGKGANMPVKEVPTDIVPLIRNKRELSLQITAALICGLVPVNAFTKIVVMDSSGGQSKAVARAITSSGFRGYVATGGFAAWKAAGLDVKGTASYDVSAADVISDKTEELTEVAVETIDQAAEVLSKPQNAAVATAAVVALLSAIVKPHETLQFLGVLGIEVSIITYLLQYDSPQAAIAGISESVANLADSVPPLPSIPSTSGTSLPSLSALSRPAPTASPTSASAASKTAAPAKPAPVSSPSKSPSPRPKSPVPAPPSSNVEAK